MIGRLSGVTRTFGLYATKAGSKLSAGSSEALMRHDTPAANVIILRCMTDPSIRIRPWHRAEAGIIHWEGLRRQYRRVTGCLPIDVHGLDAN